MEPSLGQARGKDRALEIVAAMRHGAPDRVPDLRKRGGVGRHRQAQALRAARQRVASRIGRLEQRRKHDRFAGVDPLRLFAEHHPRGGGHALQFAAIGGQVEVRFEDLRAWTSAVRARTRF